VRVRVWWRLLDLDRALAEGIHPWKSPELETRAAQLAKPRHRAMLAGRIESAVLAARQGRPTSLVPVCRSAILEAEDDLLELASILRSSARCNPHAVALVSFLCRDGSSPFYYAQAQATPAQLAHVALAGFTSPDATGRA
jgi:hypothetical protein